MAGILKNRVAIVTGSGQGIGRAIALALASEGAKVVTNNRGKGTLGGDAESTASEIAAAGGRAVPFFGDISESGVADRLVRKATEEFGRLDILINNAGMLRDSLVFDMSDEEFDTVMKVILYGTFYCTRAACRIMKEQRYGRILNVSSASGLGMAGKANYSAAKEGVVGFTRTVAKEMQVFETTCNAIRPRATTRIARTSRHDELQRSLIRKTGTAPDNRAKTNVALPPEDIAPLVAYLVSEQAGAVTGCVFDAAGNFIALYDDPPKFARTIFKEEGRWDTKELVDLMPATLTSGLARPSLRFEFGTTSDAKGWKLVGGKLESVHAKVR